MEDECQRGLGRYDDDLHILAVFVIFIASGIGCILPYFSVWYKSNFFQLFVDMATMMGNGVMLALGFIHLLVPGILQLTDDCVTDKLITPYEAFGGFFAMLACLIVLFVQYIAYEYVSHPHFQNKVETNLVTGTELKEKQVDVESGVVSKLDDDPTAAGAIAVHEAKYHQAEQNKFLRWVMIGGIEFATDFHSVIVGLALGVASDPDFKPLFIALVFHQLLEGLGVGCRLSDPTNHIKHGLSAVLMMAYSLTTPIGIMVGILLRNSYDETDSQSLVASGVIDSLAAGFIIHNSVFILSETIINPKFLKRSTAYKSFAAFNLLVGAGIMSFIGKYA